mmetsp:Transcript_76522/g.248237  ORF Transcript_76522/g.248237 Transcript_76522/m.248237 type:complete len:105 (+) Transcript_76522:130-444(+)
MMEPGGWMDLKPVQSNSPLFGGAAAADAAFGRGQIAPPSHPDLSLVEAQPPGTALQEDCQLLPPMPARFDDWGFNPPFLSVTGLPHRSSSFVTMPVDGGGPRCS